MKKYPANWNDPGARASSQQPVIPPAPLTGDAGRGCGDANRALLFFAKYMKKLVWLALGCRNANPARHQARRTHFTSLVTSLQSLRAHATL
jgi:hypothetical protein